MTYKTQTQVTSLNRFVVPAKRIPASASSYSSRFGQQQLNDSGIYPQRRDTAFLMRMVASIVLTVRSTISMPYPLHGGYIGFDNS